MGTTITNKNKAIIIEAYLQITTRWQEPKYIIIYVISYHLYLKPCIWIYVYFIYMWSPVYATIVKGLKQYVLVVVLK